MKAGQAIDALGALAQEHRLQLFRLLVQAGAEGMAAGELARAIDIPNSSLSFHLGHLQALHQLVQKVSPRLIGQAADFFCEFFDVRVHAGKLPEAARNSTHAFQTFPALTFTSAMALRVSTMTCAQSASSWLLAFLWFVEITTTS